MTNSARSITNSFFVSCIDTLVYICLAVCSACFPGKLMSAACAFMMRSYPCQPPGASSVFEFYIFVVFDRS